MKENKNESEKKEEINITNIKAKKLDTKAYLRQHIRNEQIRRITEELLSSPSPIVEFKKVPKLKNHVLCTLLDGTRHVVPVNCTLQLFFDKMEMHPDTVVDFGRDAINRVEVFPYQNKIVYINGFTNEVIKSIPIDCNLIYEKTDSITNNHVEIDKRLNPAILSILDKDIIDQKAYMNGTGAIKVTYNFEQKSDKATQNISNKKLAKKMNEYYLSEQEYAEELEAEAPISQKVGYVGVMDKIKTNLSVKKENAQSNNQSSNESSSFGKTRNEFLNDLNYKGVTTPSRSNFKNTRSKSHSKEVVE